MENTGGARKLGRKKRTKKGTKKTGSAGKQLVNVLSKSLEKNSGRELSVASRYEIARMKEPWELDRTQMAEKRIIFPGMADREMADSFRRLRTKIIQKSNSDNSVIMVTGLSGGSGTSFTALNLATAFAFDESKTALVVDCNLQKPGLMVKEKQGEYGLVDYLEEYNDEMEVGDIIYSVGIKRLRLMPCGSEREDVIEHFTSMKMRELIESIKGRYQERYIILDSPPIVESADAGILAELSDYTILVVPYGKYTETRIEKAVKAVGREKFLGIVFNNVPRFPKLSAVKFELPWKRSAPIN